MKYALTASITAVILLLIVVGGLLLNLAHGSLQCEIKGTFNQVDNEDSQVTDENRESKKRPKNTPKPSFGILVPGPPPETLEKQGKENALPPGK